MRFWILGIAAAFIGLISLPSSTRAQVVAQYYGRPYYNNYYGSNQNAYHQRLQRYNTLGYGRYSTSPYGSYNSYNTFGNSGYYNTLRHQTYHNGLGSYSYGNRYNRYGQSGVYYNTPGFGFRFSF